MHALLAALLLLSAPPQSPAPRDSTKAPPPRTIAELEARLRQVLDSTHTPGMSLALVTRDSVVYAGGLGLADVAGKRPASAKTLFRIGSTSKAFTALTVLMLQEEGKLRLDDPIQRHIPDMWQKNAWDASDPIRIVNLLEHTTGFDDNSLMSYANSDPTPLTLAQGLRLDSLTHVSRWRPGTSVSYCNTGPPLAAYIVEKLEGRPFEQVVQDRLFTPLGMVTATYLFPDTARIPTATLYDGDGVTPVPYWYVFLRPAGSINASAEDMAAYVRFLLNRGTVNGRALLPASAIDRLERGESWEGRRHGLTDVGYGLHIARYTDSLGYVWTGHDGGVEGGLTEMAYIPELGVGFAFMINSGNGAADRQISRLVRDFVTKDTHPPVPVPVTAMPADAATLDGWYRPDNPRMQHAHFVERLAGLTRVRATDSTLVVEPLFGDEMRLLPVGERLFRRQRDALATVTFFADSANNRPMVMEQMGYLLPTSFVRVSSTRAIMAIVLTAAWFLGLALTVLVILVSVVRWAIRRLRKRSVAAPAARPLWSAAIAEGVVFVMAVALVLKELSGRVTVAGTANFLSVTTWLMFLLFAALAIFGGLVAFRRVNAGSRWARLSVLTARSVLLLHVVAAAYLTYWGLIGWQTWQPG